MVAGQRYQPDSTKPFWVAYIVHKLTLLKWSEYSAFIHELCPWLPSAISDILVHMAHPDTPILYTQIPLALNVLVTVFVGMCILVCVNCMCSSTLISHHPYWHALWTILSPAHYCVGHIHLCTMWLWPIMCPPLQQQTTFFEFCILTQPSSSSEYICT